MHLFSLCIWRQYTALYWMSTKFIYSWGFIKLDFSHYFCYIVYIGSLLLYIRSSEYSKWKCKWLIDAAAPILL